MHVTGTRMIAQGTDVLYIGLVMEVIMSGEDMLAFVPIHLSALKLLDNLLEWINSW